MTVQVGTRVQYFDQANPLRTGTVDAVTGNAVMVQWSGSDGWREEVPVHRIERALEWAADRGGVFGSEQLAGLCAFAPEGS